MHVNGSQEFLYAVIEAGADTIEHGPLDDKAIALMKKHGTANTPTLLAAKMIDYRTDLGIMGPERSHEEFGLLAAAGIPPEQVLKTPTINAAGTLGPLGEGLGSIAPGKVADVIAMQVDPLLHIHEVGEPCKVVFLRDERWQGLQRRALKGNRYVEARFRWASLGGGAAS